MGFLAALWFFPTLGAAVFGFLLKKNSIVETGPTGPLVGQNSEAGFANGWGGLAACAIVGLIAVLVVGRTQKASTLSSASEAASPSVPDATTPAKTHTWELSEKSDPMDGTKETSLSLTSEDKVEGFIGSHSAYLFVRCAKGKPEVFVSLGVPIEAEYGSDTYGVRVKFDDEAAAKFRWNASTDREALFAPAPAKLVKLLEQSQVFLFEFTPFQKRATAIKFNVAGLREKLPLIAASCGLAISDAQPNESVAVVASHSVLSLTEAKAKDKSQENTELEKSEPAPSAEAAEFKQRLDEAINEKGLTGRATVQISGNMLTIAGKLRPSEHATLIRLAREAPKGVRVLDYIGYDDSPLR